MTMRKFETVPLDSKFSFGAQVFGLTQEALEDPEVGKALKALWIEKGVLVFRGVTGTGFQIELSKCFGELIEHPTKEAQSSRPEISSARYTPEDGNVYDVDGDLRGNWLPWHTDLFYKPWINRGGILRSVVVPSRHGKTGYIDKSLTYQTLPDDLKKKIANLKVIYRFNFEFDTHKFVTNDIRTVRTSEVTKSIHARAGDFPQVVHPMVFTHAELGLQCLNASPSNAIGIQGMLNEEGDALLREVLRYATNEELAYYHSWHIDDMVQWDNWRMLHCATGGPADEERWIERTTIAGDYGLGQYADADQDQKELVSIDG